MTVMKKCEHRQVRREAYMKNGTWGEFKRCVDCQQPQPLGPANDSGFVSYEIYAAEVAAWYVDGSGDGATRKEPVAFIAGLTGSEPAKGTLESSPVLSSLYDCGMLARSIRDAANE